MGDGRSEIVPPVVVIHRGRVCDEAIVMLGNVAVDDWLLVAPEQWVKVDNLGGGDSKTTVWCRGFYLRLVAASDELVTVRRPRPNPSPQHSGRSGGSDV